MVLRLSFPISKTRGLGQVAQAPFQVKAVRSAALCLGEADADRVSLGWAPQGGVGRGLAPLRSLCSHFHSLVHPGSPSQPLPSPSPRQESELRPHLLGDGVDRTQVGAA